MPRPRFPHTLGDIVHHVDGPLGLVVGDNDDGTVWVLVRNRKLAGRFTLTHYQDAARSAVLGAQVYVDRRTAIDAMAAAIGLPERLPRD